MMKFFKHTPDDTYQHRHSAMRTNKTTTATTTMMTMVRMLLGASLLEGFFDGDSRVSPDMNGEE